MSSVAGEVAATVQAAHIRTDPDPELDIAPSTAADEKLSMTLEDSTTSLTHAGDVLHHDDAIDQDDRDDQDDIPYRVLRPTPRKRSLPPLPDLRFEQSYLHSISNADSWWKVLLITARDQIVMPLAQGLMYNLVLCGWQHWNRNARLHGNSAGARLRRWWYGVNNWTVPRRKA